MTREEAISILKMMIPKDSRGNGKVLTKILVTEAISNAVEALEQEPTMDILLKIRNEITMLTLFNRENVIDIIDKYREQQPKTDTFDRIKEEINEYCEKYCIDGDIVSKELSLMIDKYRQEG